MKLQLGESKKTWQRLANRFWQDERGQSTTEYILILSVVVMIALKFKQTFSSKLMDTITKVGTQMDEVTNDQ